jgi:hypothetical protein
VVETELQSSRERIIVRLPGLLPVVVVVAYAVACAVACAVDRDK